MKLDHEAIRKAYPSVVVIYDAEGAGAFDSSNNKVTLEQSKIDTARTEINSDYAKVKYKDDRVYASIGDQLDQLYWDKKNGTNKWVEAIDKIKSDNPKP